MNSRNEDTLQMAYTCDSGIKRQICFGVVFKAKVEHPSQMYNHLYSKYTDSPEASTSYFWKGPFCLKGVVWYVNYFHSNATQTQRGLPCRRKGIPPIFQNPLTMHYHFRRPHASSCPQTQCSHFQLSFLSPKRLRRRDSQLHHPPPVIYPNRQTDIYQLSTCHSYKLMTAFPQLIGTPLASTLIFPSAQSPPSLSCSAVRKLVVAAVKKTTRIASVNFILTGKSIVSLGQRKGKKSKR